MSLTKNFCSSLAALTCARTLLSGWQQNVFAHRITMRSKSFQSVGERSAARQQQNVAWVVQPKRPFGSPNSSFRQLIFSCQTVTELARSASRFSPLTAENAISVLRRAIDLMPAGPSSAEVIQQLPPEVLNDVVSSIHDNMHLLSFDQLLTVVTFCLKFNLPSDSQFWVSVERQVRFVIPKLDINQLLSLVKLFDTSSPSKKVPTTPTVINKLADDITKILRGRLPEVTKPADLLFCLYKFSPPSTQVSGASTATRELNDRLVACIGRLTPKQLYRAFYVQTRLDSRHTPLLRAIAYYLRQPGCLDSLAHLHLLNILYACSELNVTEARLMKVVVAEVKKRYAEYSPANLVALARSVGSLQLRDAELIGKLIQSGVQLKNKVIIADAIVAAGATGVYPDKSDVQLTAGEIITQYLGDVAKADSSLWLKLVWSLFVLNLDKTMPGLEEVILPIFTDEFAADLLKTITGNKRPTAETDGKDKSHQLRNPASRRIRLQMANIRELIRLDHPVIYAKLPAKPSPLLSIPTGDCRIRVDRPQFDLCLDTFAGFCDVKKYVTMDRPTDGGACIDFVVYVDQAGELVPTDSHLSNVDKTKGNPNQRPVAIKVCEYAEQTLLETQPNGLAQLHARLFGLLGYQTVILTTSCVARSMPIAQRAQNLQEMIKKAASCSK